MHLVNQANYPELALDDKALALPANSKQSLQNNFQLIFHIQSITHYTTIFPNLTKVSLTYGLNWPVTA